MKRLILLRHAKSDWNVPVGGDRDRPLAARGRRAARQVGRFLTAVGRAPERVLTSPAVRARDTVALAAEAGAWPGRPAVVEALYGGGTAAVVAAVQALDDACNVALAAGHEPIWSQTVGLLIGHARVRMPTAAAACIELPVSRWAEVEAGRGELAWLVTPKLLRRLAGDD